MLIEGDNLDALKALLPYYKVEVKCIFIDSPHNTKSAARTKEKPREKRGFLPIRYRATSDRSTGSSGTGGSGDGSGR